MKLRKRVEVACRAARDGSRSGTQGRRAPWWSARVEGTDFDVYVEALPRDRTRYHLTRQGMKVAPNVQATRVAEFIRDVVRRFGEDGS